MEKYEPVKTYPALSRKRGHKKRRGEGHHEHMTTLKSALSRLSGQMRLLRSRQNVQDA